MKRSMALGVLLLVLTGSVFGQASPLALANDLSEESTTLAIGKLPARGQVSIFIDGITSQGRAIPLGAVFTAKTRTALISRMGTRVAVVTDLARADYVIRGEVYPLGDQAVFAITLEDRGNGTILGGFDKTVDLDPDLRRQIAVTGGSGGSDPYEPNDSAPDGYVVNPGDTLPDATLSSGGDNDWYVIDVPRASATALVITVGTRGDLDTYIEVYGPDDPNQYLGENDDSEGSNARFTFTSTDAGTYYVLVRGYDSDATGTYTFYSEIEEANPDSFEPDDSASRASAMVETRTDSGHTLSPPGDVDWYRIELPAGANRILNVATAGTIDTVMELYDDHNNLLTENDDFMDQNAQVQYLTTGGTFFAAVRGYDSSSVGPYDISYWTEEAVLDDFEPDNAAAEATELVPDARPQTHTLVPASDSDYFTFSLTTSLYVVLETDGDTDTYMTLYDESESMIAEDDDGGSDYNAQISTNLAPGTYYVEVHQLNDVSGAEYQISMQTYSK